MKIKIRVESLPLHFIILGAVMDIFASFNLIINESVLFNAVLLLIGVLLLTTHQKLEIDLERKVYSEFYWVLGMKMNNYTESYQEITAVVCTSGNYSQQYGKYNRRFISGTMYKGYIELRDQEALYVGQNKNIGRLMKKLNKISGQLKVPLEDRTKDKEEG